MVRYRSCSVMGCEDKFSSRHRFPDPTKNLDIFQKWVLACGNKELLHLPPEDTFRTKRICHIHFKEDDIYSNMLLKKGVVPSLFLPVRNIFDLDELTSTLATENVSVNILQVIQDEHLYAMGASDDSVLKCIPTEEPLVSLVKCVPPRPMEDLEPVASLLKCVLPPPLKDLEPVTSTSAAPEIVENLRDKQGVIPSTSGESTRKKHNQSVLGEIGLTRTEDLTPKARYLYNKNRNLNKSLQQLKVRRTLFKTKVPKKNSQEILHEALTPLQRHVADFIKSQINAIGKDPRGRRFTTDDKIMGLILHKQSGRAYRTMQKLFCLPSRKTLMALLNRIPVGAGINDCIFRNLKANAALLKPEDKYCILMFDEMSIEPHINLNIHENCFEGFESYGDGEKATIADHAQVFMLKGLQFEWKQPVAYTFCKGTTSKIQLVRQFKRNHHQMFGDRSEGCGNCQRPRGYKSGCSELFNGAFCSPV